MRAVRRVDGSRPLIPRTEKQEGTRDLVQVEGEVLTPGEHRSQRDVLFSDYFPGNLMDQLVDLGVIDGRGNGGVLFTREVDLSCAPVHRRLPFYDLHVQKESTSVS